MLIIRAEQMKALADANRSAFEQQLATQLDSQPADVASRIEAALGSGVTRECDVALFVEQSMRADKALGAQTSQVNLEAFSTKSIGQIIQPCSQQQRLYWIEIELLGEDDSPIPNEQYRIRLPNGEQVTGRLDANGNARLESIVEAGACQISFPDLDTEAWEPINT